MGKGKALRSTDFNETTEARFWAKVDVRGSDECWEWQGARLLWGYGRAHIGWKQPVAREQKAHRVAWCLANPGMSTGELVVLHSCDNPPCVNPAHLSLGTVAENMAEMVERGRGRAPSGEEHGRAVFTDKFIATTILRVWDGESQRSVARSIGVRQASVSKWASGEQRKTAHMEALLCVNT